MTNLKYTRFFSIEWLVVSSIIVYQIDGFVLKHGTSGNIGNTKLVETLKAVTELIPEKNLEYDTTTISPLSEVPYISVLSGLEALYPPEDLQTRNAVSRTDGYWSFVREGSEPPQHLTYGEFDFFFFAELLDHASHYHNHGGNSESNHFSSSNSQSDGWDDKVFADIGSGTGRLVFGAAALHPGLKLCRGIELLPGIHDIAVENLHQCIKKEEETSVSNPTWHSSSASYLGSLGSSLQSTTSHMISTPSTNNNENKKYALPYSIPSHIHIPPSSHIPRDAELPLAPIDFECGSFEDPYLDFSNIDIAFAFSTCFVGDTLNRLSQALGRGCKPGTIIITTDYMLPLKGTIEPLEDHPNIPFGDYELELVEQMNGSCWLTGGTSTAYIHRVVKSLYKE